jgi:hypothetical protein
MLEAALQFMRTVNQNGICKIHELVPLKFK